MSEYKPGFEDRCPSCLVSVQFMCVYQYATNKNIGNPKTIIESRPNNKDVDRDLLSIMAAACPNCGKIVMTLMAGAIDKDTSSFQVSNEYVVWPLQTTRPLAPEVPEHIAADYKEAALVLNLSPKASAALSRRCLQNVLVEAGGANPKNNLSQQIDYVMPKLPSYIKSQIDAIRNVGNFAAHPMKDTNTGVIIEVEPYEAEWNLDVLDLLFDEYYVKPVQVQKMRDELNNKLAKSGKRLMK